MPRSEEVRFRAGELSLAGTLVVPDGSDARHPWALLVGSWLPRDRDGGWDRDGHPDWFAPEPPSAPPGLLARLAAALAERRVASLRYDPRGTGASGGTWETADLFSRIDDARDAIGAMRSRSELDLRRTAVVGHGEGAVVAVSVAISDPAIGAVGLIGAPARPLRDVLRRGVAARAAAGVDRRHPLVAELDRRSEELIEAAERREASATLRVGDSDVDLSLAALEQGIHTPLRALVTMLHRNVVLAHGTADAWSDVNESRLLAATLSAGGVEPVLQEIPGAGHDLAEAPDAAIGAFADALVSRMEPRELPPVLLAIEEMGADR